MKSKSSIRYFMFVVGAMVIMTSTSYGQDTLASVAVLSIDSSVVTRDEALVFEDYLTSHLVRTGRYVVIDRNQREVMIEEAKFVATGMGDAEKQLEIGKLLSAEFIIVGSLGKIGSNVILNLKLVQVETGQTIATVSETYRDLDQVIEDSEYQVLTLMGEDRPRSERASGDDGRGSSIEVMSAILLRSYSEEYDTEPFRSEYLELAKPGILPGIGYTYNFSRRFAVGAFATLFIINSPFLNFSDEWEDIGYYVEDFPNIGVKLIFGDKTESIAASLNISFFPSVGLYYKGVFLEVYPPLFDMAYGQGWGFGAGYSLYLRSDFIKWLGNDAP